MNVQLDIVGQILWQSGEISRADRLEHSKQHTLSLRYRTLRQFLLKPREIAIRHPERILELLAGRTRTFGSAGPRQVQHKRRHLKGHLLPCRQQRHRPRFQ